MTPLQLTPQWTGSILDVGGGGEGIIGRLYGEQVIAIDNRQEELDEAPEGFQKVLMDACHMTFPAEQFDHVTFFYSLMYLDRVSQKKALQEAYRVLKPGGQLHLWDAEIEKAYPEPFVVELDIKLPTEEIHTGYGVVSDVVNQTAQSVAALCADAGFQSLASQTAEGQFYLACSKGFFENAGL